MMLFENKYKYPEDKNWLIKFNYPNIIWKNTVGHRQSIKFLQSVDVLFQKMQEAVERTTNVMHASVVSKAEIPQPALQALALELEASHIFAQSNRSAEQQGLLVWLQHCAEVCQELVQVSVQNAA